MKYSIYADNAATTKIDPEAAEQLYSILTNDYSNPSQKYSFSKKIRTILDNSRKEIAQAINADPCEIIFTSGGTESDNWALRGTCVPTSSKTTVITSLFEHHAVLKNMNYLRNNGDKIIYLHPSKTGHIFSEELLSKIDHSTRIVSVMMVNNELGTIQPIKDLCKIAHDYGALFHTDAVQAMGHMNIDVKDLGVDMLSASAHKFNGPKGIGFLYVRKGTKLHSLIVGGEQEYGFRAGTENVASIAAMSKALINNIANITKIQSHLEMIESTFYNELNKRGVSYHINSCAPKLPGIISISFNKITGESLQIQLDIKGIYVSTGSACDSRNMQISHVLKAINLDPSLANNTIRISFGKYNTEKDAINVAMAIEQIVRDNN
ncbi:Cysteine desulfurase [Candidatus Methanomethylophilus alvi Mx1201]|uniref:cysteine desulfurase n=2 Tax=Methanomethylophilus alvi TaxID=1291540 RepID=M9SAT8_METAX|nr:cysteine desulfurase family protein [Methanomethylophilus alvi]AGI85421.2 Cysteine desulfurase [Candidatus Methanomethylophilus alvi Mx1201]AYQ54840.1 hypothetical protein BKD89_03340 [Methanomethylophilus alvi]